jgi:hypothetical protein
VRATGPNTVTEASACGKEKPMTDVYDKERTAALIKEARQLTAELKVETEKIKSQMENVLEGGEDEFLDVREGEKAAPDASILEGVVPRKSAWRFWR